MHSHTTQSHWVPGPLINTGHNLSHPTTSKSRIHLIPTHLHLIFTLSLKYPNLNTVSSLESPHICESLLRCPLQQDYCNQLIRPGSAALALYLGRVGVCKGVCLFHDHHFEEEEKAVPLGDHEDEEEAYQDGRAFSVQASADPEEEEEALTLVHKEVVTFYPVEEGASCQMVVVTGCPLGEGVALVTPWVFVSGQGPPLGGSFCHQGMACVCHLD